MIHCVPWASLLSNKFAALTAFISSERVGFIIALVIPADIAIGRNVAFIECLFGKPNEIFDAPQVVFTLSSILSRFTSSKTCLPAVAIAPIGITNGSTTMSLAGIPKSEARATIFLQH